MGKELFCRILTKKIAERKLEMEKGRGDILENVDKDFLQRILSDNVI
jgi:hypothetical protein